MTRPRVGEFEVAAGARLSQLCKGRNKRALKQMYLIRNATEHLQGPYANLPKSMTKAHRHLLLLARCTEAAALTRFLMIEYLLNRGLWSHFRSNDRVKAFWALPAVGRAKLWPTRFHYPTATRSFNPSAVKQALEEGA